MFIPLKKVAFPKKFTALVLLFTLMFSHAAFTRAASDPFEGQKVYYFLNDHLGSVDVVLDADANVVERRDYLPYGATRSHIAESDESQRQRRASQQNAYQFTGQEFDEETGLYYYGARYYDPVLGRFISPDPWEGDLSSPQTLNKYSYAVNNPVFYVDPTGSIPRYASFLSKLMGIVTYDGFGKGNGWLASSARRFVNNPSQQNSSDLINKQSLAFKRFVKTPASFADETWDSYTNKRIQQLDPRVQIPATDLINTIEQEQGKTFRVSDGYRTFAEQDTKYAQGRKNPGKIVTYAKGGESYHNYGLAIDIAEIVSGKLGKGVSESIAQIGKNLGFEWGGNWGWDYPHFQMTFEKSTSELKKEKESKKK